MNAALPVGHEQQLRHCLAVLDRIVGAQEQIVAVATAAHAYSLQKADDQDPILSDLFKLVQQVAGDSRDLRDLQHTIESLESRPASPSLHPTLAKQISLNATGASS